MKVLIAALGLGAILHAHAASAQEAVNSRAAVALRPHEDSVRIWTRADSAERPPSRVWPVYMGAGAVLGGVLVASLALAHCDQNCRDDGALAFVPPFIIGGAAAGGLVGLGIGLIVDGSRRGTVSVRLSVPAP
jgi:hypothetical protein